MLIVEETFLLLTKDNGVTDRVWSYRRHGLVAALLVDFDEVGIIDIGEGRDPRVTVVAGGTTGDPVLDDALPALDKLSGGRISAVLASTALDPAQSVGESLTRQGVVQKVPRRFGKPAFITVNPAPEIALRGRLGEVLAGEREATLADVTELGILKALNVAYGVLGPARGELDRRELARRIVAISRHVPAVEALKRTVDPVTASTTAAVTAAGAASAV